MNNNISATELKRKKVIVTFYLSILTLWHNCDYKLTFLIDIIYQSIFSPQNWRIASLYLWENKSEL